MKSFALTRSRRVVSESDRLAAIDVLRRTYCQEKGWVLDAESLFPAGDLTATDRSWFLARRSGQPVGVLRVLYDAAQDYAAYQLDGLPQGTNVAAFLAANQIAEVGRFAVVPERRGSVAISLSLMRAATHELVVRGCTQLITDVFENEPNSPLGFHTRVIGFRRIATHEHGELRHKGRRVTLLLDMKLGYRALQARSNRFFRVITRGWTTAMHASLI